MYVSNTAIHVLFCAAEPSLTPGLAARNLFALVLRRISTAIVCYCLNNENKVLSFKNKV